jgi:cysteine desulfurase
MLWKSACLGVHGLVTASPNPTALRPEFDRQMHYCDHNATSPLRPEVKAAMERALAVGGNPSSVHGAGRQARAMIDQAREQVATLVGCRAQDVIFTSGGTESNALALRGIIEGALDAGERITRLFVSTIEHDSVLATAAMLGERIPGLRVEIVPVTTSGVVDIEVLRVALREGKGRALIAVMAANNETGVIQPTAEISALAKDVGALLFVDAVQTAGKIEMDLSVADCLSLSAHKLGAAQGVGALIVKESVPFAAQTLGGGQERGLRTGTENVSGIAGFGVAVSLPRVDAAALRDRFENALPRSAIVFGATALRLANTSNFALPGITAETAVMALDLDGVMISSGAACSSGKVKPSHVLKAMGVSDDLARCALRVSFGWNSTEDDVDAALASITRLVARVEKREAA